MMSDPRFPRPTAFIRRAPAAAALLLVSLACASPRVPTVKARFDPTYPAWSTLLARYVSPEGVDYAALKDEPQLLDEALARLRDVDRDTFDGWSAAERLAFLVNAHNAFAIDRILRFYPVAALEKTAWWGSARDVSDIELLGRGWSLRDLAEAALAQGGPDSRAAFLLNWAESGCPPLPPTAVTATNIDSLLTRQPRQYLADPANCRLDEDGKTIRMSAFIAAWREPLRRDFTTLWIFLERYLPPRQAAAIQDRRPRIRWLPFDRSLNDVNLHPSAHTLFDPAMQPE